MKKARLFFAVPLILAIAAASVFTGVGDVGKRVRVNAGSESFTVSSETIDVMSVLTSGRADLGEIEPSSITSSSWQKLFPESVGYEINDAQGLASFSRFVNLGANFLFFELPDETKVPKVVYLTENIIYSDGDVSDPMTYNHAPIGTLANPFKGTFDGGGHKVVLDTSINTLGSAIGSPVGFFGATEGAMIMNLEVIGDIFGATNAPQDIGGIIGITRNTTIFNCISKVNIINYTSGGYAGGVISRCSPSSTYNRITNCINYGVITATNVASIISADATGDCEVRVCVNFGDLIGNEHAATHDIREWGGGSEWDLADLNGKAALLTVFNRAVHESKADPSHAEYQEVSHWSKHKYVHPDESECRCLWARFWGFDPDSSTDEITMAMPRIYQRNVSPILDNELMLEFQLKDLAATQILTWFEDKYLAINSADKLAADARSELINVFWQIMAVAQTRNIHECAANTFPVVVEDFLFDPETGSNALMNKIYHKWYERNESERITASYDLVMEIMTAWYIDCSSFIKGDDELAEQARIDLAEMRDYILGNEDIGIKGMLDILVEESANSTILAVASKKFINDYYGEFDNIYYEWEFAVMLGDLEEAYNEIAAKASGGNKVKVQRIYEKAISGIDTIMDEHKEWTQRAAAAWTIHDDTMEEFSALLRQWEKDHSIVIWLSVVSGLVLLAAGIVCVLLLVMRKRERKYNAIAFENKRDWKASRLSKKVDAMSRQNEAERERADQIAKLQREKAEALAKQRELQIALERSAQAYASATAKAAQREEARKSESKRDTGEGGSEGA